MARLSWISWLLLLCLGLLASVTGAAVYSVWMMAPALKAAIEQAVTVSMAELAIYFSLFAVLEVAATVHNLLKRGPILALAWAVAMFVAWQQGG